MLSKLKTPSFLVLQSIMLALLIVLPIQLSAQRGGLMQNFKFGFGAGVNFSAINAADEFILYEDLAGNASSNEYSTLFQNPGNQYYFQAEYHYRGVVVGIRPGTYSYKFSRENTLFFEDNEVSQKNDFSLRYFKLPLEVKYLFGVRTLQPFIGGVFSWGSLLGSGNDENLVFIKNRLAIGPIAGGYYETGFMTIALGIGYNYGLHVITRKDNRYNTSISTSYSQSDLKMNDLYANVSFLFSLEKKPFASNVKCAYPMR